MDDDNLPQHIETGELVLGAVFAASLLGMIFWTIA